MSKYQIAVVGCAENSVRSDDPMMSSDPRIELVERLFSGTGSTYDHIVNLCTAGIDRRWKRQILSRLPSRPKRVMDLAAGTGILTFAIARRFPDCHVMGVELRAEYLDIARARAAREKLDNVELILARAEDVRLSEPVDAVTSSYLAKYADLPRLACTMYEMLRPGGLVITHDFTYPAMPVLAGAWELYFKILQSVGSRRYPQWRAIFDELPDLIRQTTWVPDLVSALKTQGFTDIGCESLTLKGSGLVTAKKIS